MPKVTYACVDCGKEKTRLKSDFTQPQESYRCPHCAAKNRRGKKSSKITCICVDCGKECNGTPSKFKHVKNGGEYRCGPCARKYICTTPKWKESHAKGIVKRSNNPNWMINIIFAAQKRASNPTWIENHKLQLEQLHNDPIAQANHKRSVSTSARTPEWNENSRLAQLKLLDDPEHMERMRISREILSTNETWLKNVTESNRKKINDPVWIANQKLGVQKSHADPISKEKRKLGYEKRSKNVSYILNNKKAMQLRALDPTWINKNKELSANRSISPIWREKNLIAMSGQGFWYGHPIINKSDKTYCELWKDVNQRVHAFFNYECCLCGEKEMGISHVGHHVFYVKEVCCWHDDNGEYYTNLNVKIHRKDEYYIGDNPNYFVILCQSCHGKTNGKFENRKKWADYFKDMIDNKYDGKCYLTKEEYEIYNFNKK